MNLPLWQRRRVAKTGSGLGSEVVSCESVSSRCIPTADPTA